MKLNDKDIKTFYHGDVSSFADCTMEIVNETFLPTSSYMPFILSTTIQPQNRQLVIDFTSSDDMSNFAAELCKPCVIDVEDGYIYDGIVTGKSESMEGVRAYTGTYTFQVVKRKALITNNQQAFQVEGNCTCGCIYEISAEETISQVIVDTMVIHTMKKGQTIVIDGINKLIYDKAAPDKSAFDMCDVTAFPKLVPGLHTIHKDNEHIRVVISYYPIFM